MSNFIKSIPWAVLIAAIGAVWQLVYSFLRDRSRDKEEERKLALEKAKFENQKFIETEKFEHQKALETIRFEYEQRKWREGLATQLSLKHVDARLSEYAQLWSFVRIAARHNRQTKTLTPEASKETAVNIEAWRYSTGGLLAEELTRDAALAFQTALWHYDESAEGYHRIRVSRRLLRAALRSDLGLGEDSLGQTILEKTEGRQKIKQDLTALQAKLGIANSDDVRKDMKNEY
jgi:hypothetical protein